MWPDASLGALSASSTAIAIQPSLLAQAASCLSRSISASEAAQQYSLYGWRVLPQVVYEKKPHVTWQHRQARRGGFSPALIAKWWRDFPNAGILLMPGAGSGVCVVDCDGQEAYETFCRRLNGIPTTPTVKSGNPDPYRLHFLFSIPAELVTYTKITPWHPQLEFRGEKGLVVLPPSYHQSGNRYAWFEGRSPDELALAPLPEAIVREWQAYHAQRESNLQTLTSRSMWHVAANHSPIAEGVSLLQMHGLSLSTKQFLLGLFRDGPNWNDRLYRAACDLAGNRIPIEHALPPLMHGAGPWCDVDHCQAISTIESAYSQPRVPGRRRANPLQQSQWTLNRMRDL